jgi:enoyl-CoA hydratase
MAHEIARFPQACMRADRRSVYMQEGLSLRDAMRKEWYDGIPAFKAEGAAGAARFASGKGRHGDFGDI